MKHWEGKRVLVAGLGKSGQAAAELLVEKGARVVAADARALAQIAGGAALVKRLGIGYVQQEAAEWTAFDAVVLSPGVALDLPGVLQARAAGVAILGEVELAAGYLQGRNIGITGSNGKTTTTALTGHLLRAAGIACQVGGNIGLPPTAMIGTSQAEQWNVLELSSFQLETIAEFRAEVAACLNITPDHLDRHHTFEAYAAAKRRLFETQRAGDHAILNADDATTAAFAKEIPGEVVWFSLKGKLERGLWLEGDAIVADGERVMAVSEIPLRGRHNIENVMAAAAAAHLAGASWEAVRAGVQTFPGVEHRIEFVRELRGVRYYNDSKATNVDATLKAIDAFEGGLWIILGGKDKGSDYRPLGRALAGKARKALLIGAAAEKIAGQMEGAVEMMQCGTLEAALGVAAAEAGVGETVLLAPACASFDQFANYEERGKLFKTLVGKIV